MIKAIILDIDGTLTNSQKEISPATKEALMKAQKAGIRLAIASARSLNGLARFGRWLDFLWWEHDSIGIGKKISVTKNRSTA